MLKPVNIVFDSIVWHYYLLGVTCQAHLHCSDLQTILLPTLRQHLKMIISYSIVLHYFILSIPSYFWTIYYLVCQSTFKTHQLILDWQYEKKIPNQNLSLRNVKKKHKTKEPLVMIEPLISLFTQDDFDHIWCRCSVWLCRQTKFLLDKCQWGVFTLNRSQWIFKICIFHSQMFKTIDAECTLKYNLTPFPGALSDVPSQMISLGWLKVISRRQISDMTKVCPHSPFSTFGNFLHNYK